MKLNTKSLCRARVMAAIAIVAVGVHMTVDVSLAADPQPGSFEVSDGKVDKNTYQGWRVFHSACHVCHGIGAVGTDIAPSLLPRMESLTPREFAERVLTRYRLLQPGDSRAAANPTPDRQAVIDEVIAKKRGPKGRISMPGWERDEQISVHILDLYAYLSARADGRIGAGEPGVIPAR